MENLTNETVNNTVKTQDVAKEQVNKAQTISLEESMKDRDIRDTTTSKWFMVDPRNIVVVEEGSEANIRTEDNYGDLDSLMEDIMANGLAIPLLCKKIKGTDKYQLIDGHRRFRAIKKAIALGFPMEGVKVLTTTASTQDIIFQMISTGSQQEKLDEFSLANAVNKLLACGVDWKTIVKRTGNENKEYVIRNAMLLDKAPDAVKKQIKDGIVAKTSVLNLLRENTNADVVIKKINKAIDTQVETRKKEESEGKTFDKPLSVKVTNKDLKAPSSKQIMEQFMAEVEENENADTFSNEKLEFVRFFLENKNFSYEQLVEQLQKK